MSRTSLSRTKPQTYTASPSATFWIAALANTYHFGPPPTLF